MFGLLTKPGLCMGSHRLTVFVLANEYAILNSPDPLTSDGRRCEAIIDHGQRVIWIDPSVSVRRRASVLLRASSQAWRERLHSAPLTESEG